MTTATSTPTPATSTRTLPTLDEALASAKANPDTAERYARVLRVTALGAKGQPVRVVVGCEDPQTKQGPDGKPISLCQAEREIATQDLFQVRCCVACADRKVKLARRAKAKARDKAAREALKAAEATKAEAGEATEE